MNSKSLGQFLLQAAVWGSSFTLIKIALDGLAPSQIVLSRLVLGAAVLALLAWARKQAMPKSIKLWLHIGVAAIFGNVAPYLLLSYGERGTGAGVAGVLVAGTPLLTVLIATLALRKERANSRKVAGFVLGFIGVALVIGPWHDSLGSPGARIACLGAALSYAAGYVYVSKFLTGVNLSPLSLAAAQLIAAAVLQAAITPFLGWQTPHLNSPIVISVLLLGILSTGLANILYFQLIADVGATTAAAVDYVVPIFAVLFGALILNESLTWNLVAGGVVVLIGMGIAEGRLGARRRTAEPPEQVGSVDAGPTQAEEIQPEPEVALAASAGGRSS